MCTPWFTGKHIFGCFKLIWKGSAPTLSLTFHKNVNGWIIDMMNTWFLYYFKTLTVSYFSGWKSHCRCLLNDDNQQSGLPPSATNRVWQCMEGGGGTRAHLLWAAAECQLFSRCHPIRELLGNAFAHPVELGDECKCSEIKVSPWQWCSTCFSPFMSEWWWR